MGGASTRPRSSAAGVQTAVRVLTDAHEDVVMDVLEDVRLKVRAKIAALFAQAKWHQWGAHGLKLRPGGTGGLKLKTQEEVSLQEDGCTAGHAKGISKMSTPAAEPSGTGADGQPWMPTLCADLVAEFPFPRGCLLGRPTCDTESCGVTDSSTTIAGSCFWPLCQAAQHLSFCIAGFGASGLRGQCLRPCIPMDVFVATYVDVVGLATPNSKHYPLSTMDSEPDIPSTTEETVGLEHHNTPM